MASRRKLRLSWFLVKPSIDSDQPEAVIEPPGNGALQGFRVPTLSKKVRVQGVAPA